MQGAYIPPDGTKHTSHLHSLDLRNAPQPWSIYGAVCSEDLFQGLGDAPPPGLAVGFLYILHVQMYKGLPPGFAFAPSKFATMRLPPLEQNPKINSVQSIYFR